MPRGRVPFNHPPCVVCGGEVKRGVIELRAAYVKRKTCGEQCKRIYVANERKQRGLNHPSTIALQTATKICPVCGVEFKPFDYEHLSRFKRRKTCGEVTCHRTVAGRAAWGRDTLLENQHWWRPTQEVDFGAGFRDDARAAANHGNVVKLVRQPTHVATMVGHYGSADAPPT